ncbi:MAG TPA: imidazole glycerol phosphate synthase subunit HisH [Candidatus Macondimonas sp.]|nr:imidazole glycerol phosphate synthase subunit HisH [Candidatus Macondimonas sp.]
MPTLAILDYGMGNLHSMAKALERVAPESRICITHSAAELRAADRIVFPGQGAIGHCRAELAQRDLLGLLPELAREKPMLGVCLGLQAALAYSEENGGTPGLGLFPGRVQRFAAGTPEAPGLPPIRIPHMGWNRVEPTRTHPLFEGIAPGSRFYFVHSYYAPAEAPDVAAVCHYGVPFAAAMGREGFFAVQFHPEKSQHAGLRLLANFSRWDGSCPAPVSGV